jgi:phage terminase large subunit
VYGLGKLGDIEGRIYHDWLPIDEVPHEARLERYGLDFGYSNDPTAIVAVYKYDGGIILDEICYNKGLSNRQIYDILSNQERAVVIADSSEPKSIEELMTYGITVLPSIKGAGSVNKGIQYVQEQRISITKRSVNGIKEYRKYLWMPDRNGHFSIDSPPSPFDNHFCDAVRYAINSFHPLEDQGEDMDIPDDTKRVAML